MLQHTYTAACYNTAACILHSNTAACILHSNTAACILHSNTAACITAQPTPMHLKSHQCISTAAHNVTPFSQVRKGCTQHVHSMWCTTTSAHRLCTQHGAHNSCTNLSCTTTCKVVVHWCEIAACHISTHNQNSVVSLCDAPQPYRLWCIG